MIISLYRCYWPTVHSYLKPLNLTKSVQDTFGYVLTLSLEKEHIKAICALLPVGAIVEIDNDFSYNKEFHELKEILRGYRLGETEN